MSQCSHLVASDSVSTLTTNMVQIIYSATFRPNLSVAYGRVFAGLANHAAEEVWRVLQTDHLADELSSGLDTAPRRDVFSLDDLGARFGHLFDEALVGHNATVEIDLFDYIR